MKTLNIFKYCALSAVFALSVQLAVASPSIPLYEKSFSFEKMCANYKENLFDKLK